MEFWLRPQASRLLESTQDLIFKPKNCVKWSYSRYIYSNCSCIQSPKKKIRSQWLWFWSQLRWGKFYTYRPISIGIFIEPSFINQNKCFWKTVILILHRNLRACSILAFATLGLCAYKKHLSNRAVSCSLGFLFFPFVLFNLNSQVVSQWQNSFT